MASLFARCTPGSYDTLETAAKGMTHAQLACALLGTCGWQGSGYLAGVAAMSCSRAGGHGNRHAWRC